MNSPPAAATLDPEGRRLLWRCRRGLRELDVLLERFARGELPRASVEQRRLLSRFLELPDPVLVDYLLGQMIAPESELAELARRITAPAPAVGAGNGEPTPMAVVCSIKHL
jgi:antitoxin CptB